MISRDRNLFFFFFRKKKKKRENVREKENPVAVGSSTERRKSRSIFIIRSNWVMECSKRFPVKVVFWDRKNNLFSIMLSISSFFLWREEIESYKKRIGIRINEISRAFIYCFPPSDCICHCLQSNLLFSCVSAFWNAESAASAAKQLSAFQVRLASAVTWQIVDDRYHPLFSWANSPVETTKQFYLFLFRGLTPFYFITD